MSVVKLRDNIYWVGAIDYEIRNFHGYKTPYGSTYNAYLVMDDQITLIDTVKANFSDILMKNISEVVNPSDIDILISNHVEPDHSGSLPEVVKAVPEAPICTTPNGEKGLRAYYKKDWNFKVVKTGNSINTGKYTFTFLQTPMVHWPDSMATYMPNEKILFPNDAFGQHIATAERFVDEVGIDRVMERAKDYYGNIILPLGSQV